MTGLPIITQYNTAYKSYMQNQYTTQYSQKQDKFD
jgi:hypothetical protein